MAYINGNEVLFSANINIGVSEEEITRLQAEVEQCQTEIARYEEENARYAEENAAYQADIVNYKNIAERKTGKIIVPDGVTQLGHSAFYDFSILSSITLPSTLKLISYNAFRNCDSLTDITIPDSVTEIRNFSFFECAKLATVKLPSNLTVINHGTFHSCPMLNNVAIPETVTSIANYAFYGCTALNNATDKRYFKEKTSFYNGTGVTTWQKINMIEIPSAVTYMGDFCFGNCKNAEYIYIKAEEPPTLGANAFVNCDFYSIFVPKNSVDVYKSATNWSAYANIITGYEDEEIKVLEANQ